MFSFIQRYYPLVCALVAFYIGWYSSYMVYSVKQLKLDLISSNEVIKNRDRLIATTNQNIKATADQAIVYKNQRDQIQDKLTQQQKVNENDKKLINDNNRITTDLLQRVGAFTRENTKLSPHVTTTGGISTANETIPAYDYAQWQVGKNAHDDTCVAAYNNLQKIYNQQMTLINGFDK